MDTLRDDLTNVRDIDELFDTGLPDRVKIGEAVSNGLGGGAAYMQNAKPKD